MADSTENEKMAIDKLTEAVKKIISEDYRKNCEQTGNRIDLRNIEDKLKEESYSVETKELCIAIKNLLDEGFLKIAATDLYNTFVIVKAKH